MQTMNSYNLLKIQQMLEELHQGFPNYQYRIETSLSEQWFSDTLAWLLDPRGSHNLGVQGIDAFVMMIAKKRSDPTDAYNRRASHLKFGKAGRGKASSTFSLKNLSTIRDYHLSHTIAADSNQGTMYSDLVCMDFDRSDSLMIVIENKLWGKNRAGQLTKYYRAVEEKFKNQAHCREYVYLTVMGDKPAIHEDDENDIGRSWIRIGWLNDLLPLIQKLTASRPNSYIERVMQVLTWLESLSTLSSLEWTNYLDESLREAYSVCLVDELNRLTAKGNWEIRSAYGAKSISHSSVPARRLDLDIANAGLSIEICGRKGDKLLFATLILPIDVHPNQTLNLIDIAAREIMESYFNIPAQFKNSAHWKSNKVQGIKAEYLPYFEIGYKFPNAIRYILTR